MSLFKNKKGIAFGGGATRGFVHIGVIKFLQENNITFDYVAGNSIGSLVGAAYAAGKSWQDIYDFAKSVKPIELLGLNLKDPGPLQSKRIEVLVEKLIGKVTFDQLDLPLCIIAVDLVSGHLIKLCTGSVAFAVRASCSVPGIMSATPYNGKLLVDGGVLNSVPADIVREMGANKVLAINLNKDRGYPSAPKTGPAVFYTAMKILMHQNAIEKLKSANVVIEPDLANYGYSDFKNIDEMVALGEQAAHMQIHSLKRHFK